MSKNLESEAILSSYAMMIRSRYCNGIDPDPHAIHICLGIRYVLEVRYDFQSLLLCIIVIDFKNDNPAYACRTRAEQTADPLRYEWCSADYNNINSYRSKCMTKFEEYGLEWSANTLLSAGVYILWILLLCLI